MEKFLFIRTEDGLTKIDVTMQDETVWLTQEEMGELFQKAESTINEHIKNIYSEGGLKKENTMRKFGNTEFSTKPTMLKLADKYSVERLEAACEKALTYTASPRYKSIKNILTVGQVKAVELETPEPTTQNKYGITRGADYYRR